MKHRFTSLRPLIGFVPLFEFFLNLSARAVIQLLLYSRHFTWKQRESRDDTLCPTRGRTANNFHTVVKEVHYLLYLGFLLGGTPAELQ